MKQVKIRFTLDGIEYGPGMKVSDDIAKMFPEHVKESPVKEATPVKEEPKKDVKKTEEVTPKPVTKKTTKVAKK